MQFHGRTICLTGGTRGIGRALCHEFAQVGARSIIVASRTRGDLPERIGTTEIVFIPLDLAVHGAARALADRLIADHPNTSVLVNNAGVQVLGDCVAPDAADLMAPFEREIRINLTAPIALGLALMPLLLRHREPAICNITSGLALAPKQSAPVYCATKAGLASYTRALRYQAGARAPHLKVFEALPPLVETDMTKGRGRGKLAAHACARQIVQGMQRERAVIDIGKTSLLRSIVRIAPGLGYRIMRAG